MIDKEKIMFTIDAYLRKESEDYGYYAVCETEDGEPMQNKRQFDGFIDISDLADVVIEALRK